MRLTPSALARYITNSIDGDYGPNEEGFIDAGYEQDFDQFFVVWTPDDTEIEQRFRLVLEEVE